MPARDPRLTGCARLERRRYAALLLLLVPGLLAAGAWSDFERSRARTLGPRLPRRSRTVRLSTEGGRRRAPAAHNQSTRYGSGHTSLRRLKMRRSTFHAL